MRTDQLRSADTEKRDGQLGERYKFKMPLFGELSRSSREKGWYFELLAFFRPDRTDWTAESVSRVDYLFLYRAIHHGPQTQYRSNRTEYRIDRIEIRKNFQTAEKSRGWLGF